MYFHTKSNRNSKKHEAGGMHFHAVRFIFAGTVCIHVLSDQGSLLTWIGKSGAHYRLVADYVHFTCVQFNQAFVKSNVSLGWTYGYVVNGWLDRPGTLAGSPENQNTPP